MLGNKGTKKHYRTGGTRGGADQFKWDDVKGDRDRENYLGHSAMAPVGRWQNGKDLFWYTKKQAGQSDVLRAEISAIKSRDDDLINSALGLKKARSSFSGRELVKDDLKQLFSRGEVDRSSVDIERVEGLGAAPAKVHEHIDRGPSVVEKEILLLKEELVSSSKAKTSNLVDIRDLKRRYNSEEGSDTDKKTKKKKKDNNTERKHSDRKKDKKNKKDKKKNNDR